MLIFNQPTRLGAQIKTDDYSAKLENDILTLQNSKISRVYKWNNGNIITQSITDKESGKLWYMNTDLPDLSLPGQTKDAKNASFSAKIVDETSFLPKHLEEQRKIVLRRFGNTKKTFVSINLNGMK